MKLPTGIIIYNNRFCEVIESKVGLFIVNLTPISLIDWDLLLVKEVV